MPHSKIVVILDHFNMQNPKKVIGNSADPDRMQQSMAFDQGLHCLH